jgi:small redox-active disulfide protein 2
MREVKIYGSGCSKCHSLKALVENIVKENNIPIVVKYSDDFAEMAKLGILSVPAIVVDGKVKASGTIPGRDKILKWLQE